MKKYLYVSEDIVSLYTIYSTGIVLFIIHVIWSVLSTQGRNTTFSLQLGLSLASTVHYVKLIPVHLLKLPTHLCRVTTGCMRFGWNRYVGCGMDMKQIWWLWYGYETNMFVVKWTWNRYVGCEMDMNQMCWLWNGYETDILVVRWIVTYIIMAPAVSKIFERTAVIYFCFSF